MIETLIKAASDVANNIDNFGKKLEIKLPWNGESGMSISDSALDTRAEAAASSCCRFFGLPNGHIVKGDSIGVRKMDLSTKFDDVFQYNMEQFKQMGCTSFEDMTKVWAHECGHRVLQDILPESWADELGSDIFSGIRSEMLGLPKSNFEKFIGNTPASRSHPGGQLRLEAMDYGRKIVRDMKKVGEKPTLEKCIEKIKNSEYSKMSYENQKSWDGNRLSGVINKEYHYGKAAEAQSKVNWNLKKANEMASKGDFKKAKEYSHNAGRWSNTVRDEKRSAERCSKLVDTELTGLLNERGHTLVWRLDSALGESVSRISDNKTIGTKNEIVENKAQKVLAKADKFIEECEKELAVGEELLKKMTALGIGYIGS